MPCARRHPSTGAMPWVAAVAPPRAGERMEVLISQVLLRSPDPVRLQRFYRDQLGLAVAREYPGGSSSTPGPGSSRCPDTCRPNRSARPGGTVVAGP